MPNINKPAQKSKNAGSIGKPSTSKAMSSAKIDLKKTDTASSRNSIKKFIHPPQPRGYKDDKINEKSNKSKSDVAYRASSMLVQSKPRTEASMTTIEKMEATRKGISKKELEELKKRTGLDYDQLAHMLQVARATLISKKGAEKFSLLLSEKIMSIADIYSYGYEVFGSEPAFNEWIYNNSFSYLILMFELQNL